MKTRCSIEKKAPCFFDDVEIENDMSTAYASAKSGLFLENTNQHNKRLPRASINYLKSALMGGLIMLKYRISDFFKSDEVAEDMCLLKLM